MVMAVNESSGGCGGSGWSKWHIALVIGAPVVVGIGVWYLKNRDSTTSRDSSTTEDGRKNKVESMAASSYTPLDMVGEEPNVPFQPAEEVWNEMTKECDIYAVYYCRT
jgi:hypothetical protein